MATDWSVGQARCDYCGNTLTVLRVGQRVFSEWHIRADGWIGAEGHEAYHQAIEDELRETAGRERSSS